MGSVLALAGSIKAHLFISSPPPIPGSAPKSPLLASGANFPCHGVSLPGPKPITMPVGSSQLLAFDTGNGANTAVHGGGSCQISITYEPDAAKIKDPASWHVLYSILGGCPTNSPMNLNGEFMGMDGKDYTGSYPCTDPNTNGYDCVNQFNFSIPQGVQNGPATLAWTWFNNVGNREMYMNCVAVDITGGQSNANEMSQFPEMFVANLASIDNGQCKTTEQENVDFPDPGAYVTTKHFSTKTAKDYPLVVPSDCGSVGSASAPAATGVANTAAPSAAPSSAPVPVKNNNPTTLAVSTSAPALAAPSSAAATNAPVPSSDAGSAPTTGAASAPSAPASSTGSCAAGSVSCTTPGNLVCMDSLHFGICDINNCAVTQDVADGTQCVDGAIAFAPAGTGNARRSAPQHTHLARHVRRIRN